MLAYCWTDSGLSFTSINSAFDLIYYFPKTQRAVQDPANLLGSE